jgi:hypothetical protein
MQHHFLCNISNVVIAESMGKGLKCTTNMYLPIVCIDNIYVALCRRIVVALFSQLHCLCCICVVHVYTCVG